MQSKARPLKDRLQAADTTSEVIDFSPAVNRVSRFLEKTEVVKDDVDEKITWLTNVMRKTADLNTAVAEMEEWLPGMEENVKDLGPVSSNLEIIKEQMATVEVRL